MATAGPNTPDIPKPLPILVMLRQIIAIAMRALVAGALLALMAPLFSSVITGVYHSFFGHLFAKSIYQPLVFKVAGVLPTALTPLAPFFPFFPLAAVVSHHLYQRYVSTKYLGNKEVYQRMKSSLPWGSILAVAATITMFNLGANMLQWSIFGGVVGILKVVTEEVGQIMSQRKRAEQQQKHALAVQQAAEARRAQRLAGRKAVDAALDTTQVPSPVPGVQERAQLSQGQEDLSVSASQVVKQGAEVVDEQTDALLGTRIQPKK